MRQCERRPRIAAFSRPLTTSHKPVRADRRGRKRGDLVYIAPMSATPPSADQPRRLGRPLALLAAVVVLAIAAYVIVGKGGLSLEALIRHRMAIAAFVHAHRVLSVLIYIMTYTAAVAVSLPGAVFLTVTGGFLFGLMLGAAAAVVGATAGATLIFLIARTALGEPLLRHAGPRAAQLAQGFREDAFSYLLFLRLVPAFPFFLVNLVPAFAGVRLTPFIAATALGVIPAAFVYAFAGTGLDSIIAAQEMANHDCLAAGRSDCHLVFDARDILTPQLIGALIALGLLALVPVLVKRLRARSRATM